MIKKIKCTILFILTAYTCSYSQSKAISSAILNFGSNTCGNSTNVEFTLIGKPQTAPYVMSNCIINPPFNDVYSKFIAYNPKDNAVYINDIQSGDSRLYIYNMGLPLDYSCPAVMPTAPNYLYSYVPNNFEFDIVLANFKNCSCQYRSKLFKGSSKRKISDCCAITPAK